MCNHFFCFICNYDFYRVVLQTLSFMDRNRICDLKGNNSRIVIFIILISTPMFVYTERDNRFSSFRFSNELKSISRSINFINCFLYLNIEPNLLFTYADIDNSSFWVIMNQRGKYIRLIKQYWIAYFISVYSPINTFIWIAILQETVDIIDSI